MNAVLDFMEFQLPKLHQILKMGTLHVIYRILHVLHKMVAYFILYLMHSHIP